MQQDKQTSSPLPELWMQPKALPKMHAWPRNSGRTGGLRYLTEVLPKPEMVKIPFVNTVQWICCECSAAWPWEDVVICPARSHNAYVCFGCYEAHVVMHELVQDYINPKMLVWTRQKTLGRSGKKGCPSLTT
jgi:hypothetical protein